MLDFTAPTKPLKSPKNLAAFAARVDHCQCCGVGANFAAHARWPGLEIHHIVRRGRSDDLTNLIRLCRWCHDAADGRPFPDGAGGYWPALPLAAVLALKRLRDPGEWDADRMRSLLLKNLPDPVEVPPRYLAEYCRNRHPFDCPCTRPENPS